MSSAASPRKRIFCLDDDSAVLNSLRMLLNYGGYEAVCCSTADELMKAVAANHLACSLVVLDQYLPNASGLDIARQLRQLYPNLPTIVTSGFVEGDLQQQARAIGVRAVVSKPFNSRDFLSLIRQITQAPAPDGAT